MSEEILQSAHQFPVADRAGQLIIQRKSWLATVKTDGDTVVVGYLPAGHRLHAPSTQVIFEAALGTGDIDVAIGTTSNKLIDSGGNTNTTFKRVGATTYELAETLGVSDENRPIILHLVDAPAAGGGNVIVDIGYYAP